MATQAWQMPDVDAEKYQSVTKQGGARSEITRHVFAFYDRRVGCIFEHPQQSTHRMQHFAAVRFVRTEVGQQPYDNQRSGRM